jgi:hypothetical protein
MKNNGDIPCEKVSAISPGISLKRKNILLFFRMTELFFYPEGFFLTFPYGRKRSNDSFAVRGAAFAGYF